MQPLAFVRPSATVQQPSVSQSGAGEREGRRHIHEHLEHCDTMEQFEVSIATVRQDCLDAGARLSLIKEHSLSLSGSGLSSFSPSLRV